MPLNADILTPNNFLITIRIKQSLGVVTKLMPILVTTMLLFSEIVEASTPLANLNQEQVKSATLNHPANDELAITPGEARLMTQELNGLINRFKATLLMAEATQSNVDISTESVIRKLLESDTITQKANSKLNNTKYQNSHLALQLATKGRQKFNYLVEQQHYQAAREEWAAAQKILWSNYPQSQLVAQSEIRAMWFDRGTIVKAKSENDLIEIFDQMAIAGINTVFFETLNSSYTIYPSQIAPQQNPLTKGWDPLKAAVKLAHERDMELHAWIWTFAAANERHNEILNLPRYYLGPVLSQRPQWAMTDQQGNYFNVNSGKVFFDPANREVRAYLQALIAEITSNYEVDGIHLDYIRYPFPSSSGQITYGYSNVAREQFRRETGYDPLRLNPGDPLWPQWVDFRTKQVDTFVAQVDQQLKQINPKLILSTAVFPMPQRDRLNKIQQGWETWVKEDWIDMLVPMTYAQDAEQLNSLTTTLLREFTPKKALLLPGIRLLNMSEVVALDQMQLLRGLPTEGYSLFAAENLNSSLATIFNQTQGDKLSTSQQLPHREPFQATLSRYRSLQQEWNFFLTTYPGATDDQNLLEWGQQADRFGEELQTFIDQPTNKNLLSVQLAQGSLRQKFSAWVRQTKNIDPYQAQVWQNRLNTLDRLLSYGARKQLNY